ncbi:MAG: VWA domain-containing protein [Gammaproteobacteria bacterium]|nr:VWA domain-containing protein [Gammaproteobacteria bacterium]
MKHNLLYPLLILAALNLLSCGENSAELELTQSRSKATLGGTFFTENPDEIKFPTKILFAIDISLSMGFVSEDTGEFTGADPYNLRIQAVQAFIEEYNDDFESVSFEVMLWSNSIMKVTTNGQGEPGFTKDVTVLNWVLDDVENDTTTDYVGALQGIYNHLSSDIRDVKEDNELSRTKYIVVFLSDGIANVGGENGSGAQADSDIWDIVTSTTELMEDNGVGSFNFHTFLLLGGFTETQSSQNFRERAEITLQGMSDRGNGRFELFESAEAIDFIDIVDLRLAIEYFVKFIVAYNYNVSPGVDLVFTDSDGDGLTDAEEAVLGTNPVSRDTDRDGLSDGFEIQISFPGNEVDPLSPDSNCSPNSTNTWPDTDQDGLTDCEEFVKGTNRETVDYDADGIPDGIEFLTGANPFEDQEGGDADFDLFPDWLEIQRHTNVTSSDPKLNERYAYAYSIQDKGLITVNQGQDDQSLIREFAFDISNIDIRNTDIEDQVTAEQWANRDADYVPGDNLIRIYIAQVPQDAPDDDPIYRLAEVRVNFYDKERNYTLSPNDFSPIQ